MLIVFGSVNLDIAIPVRRMPASGETLVGGAALMSPGGKGANQAHAARRYGTPTRLYATVGTDAFGELSLSCLRRAGVDLGGVALCGAHPTGMAVISVTPDGDNAIVVAPGANAATCAQQVADVALRAARVLLLQLETGHAESAALARRASQAGCKVILNASPMPEHGDVDLEGVDVLIVNQLELQQLAARLGIGEGLPAALALAIARRHAADVVVTLGAAGSLLASPDGSLTVQAALPVQALDTTGAGDTFAGVLAAAVAEGVALADAMHAASVAAALACTAAGAQLSQPGREQISACLARTSPLTEGK